jgi:hypothetical protein
VATFSGLIDAVLVEVARPDLLTHATTYLQQVIRECHLDPERGTPVCLWPNYAEAQVTADAEIAYQWPLPDTTRFQAINMVRYDSVWRDNYQVFALPLARTRAGNDQEHAYQLVGDRLIFKGYGGLGGVISISYYQYPRALKYYPLLSRPATYDEEAGYRYHASYDADDASRESARELTTNWLLERWPMVLEEGLRAKIYKRLGDETRARLCYSSFMQLRTGLINSEMIDLGGVR